MTPAVVVVAAVGVGLDAPSPTVRVHTLLTAWQHDWPILIAAGVEAATVIWYVVWVRRLSRRGRKWSPARTAAFMAGMATVVIAIQSGLAAYDDANFTAHVVQHLLLMNLAPPLLALGAPVTLALQSSKRRTTTAILKVLHSLPARAITHPVVAAALMVATMYAYFLTPIYRISIEHVWFHYYTHLHFLLAGCLYWWPIVGTDVLPRRWGHGAKLLLLFAAVPWSSFLGVAIMQMSRPIAPEHTLADTHAGGGLLWVASEFFTLSFMLVVFFDWARADLRQAARADRLTDALVASGTDQAQPAITSAGTTARGQPARQSTWAMTKELIRRPGQPQGP